jgi:hypothetical protein
MIEVFKTNVTDQEHATMLVDRIHKTFTGYKANFDLDDCDNILRVKCSTGYIQSSHLIDLLRNFGFSAEVLPDECYLVPDQHDSKYNW